MGEVSQHSEYFAFGETFIEEHKNSHNSPYKFNGKELDEESGLYYYGARYYDPRISIWASVDPLVYDGTFWAGKHNKGFYNSFNHGSYMYCYQNPVVLIDPNGKQVNVTQSNWSNNTSNINALIANGISGLDDLNRNCSMCCLNALASNLKSLYGLIDSTKIKTNGTLSDAVTSLQSKYYQRIKNIAPTYNDKRLTSRSHNDINSDDLGTAGSDINSNITDKLLELTANDGISVFAVGMGAEYHSTLVVVSKDPNNPITVDGVEFTGSNEVPLFFYIEDGGGSRIFFQDEFENNMKTWIYSARKFYRGDKTVTGARSGDKKIDVSLDATVIQLKKE